MIVLKITDPKEKTLEEINEMPEDMSSEEVSYSEENDENELNDEDLEELGGEE